ncbi:hypothetical protein [Pseudomonas azerbaijanoccidentalis]|uniref:hypothetical protein n=1 Tax=Pseudomonas azerbaijanoccidentalis TaxID=2842347 RepID=UPI003F5A1657
MRYRRKRSITNAVQVFLAEGTSSEKVDVECPMGHLCKDQVKLEAASANRFMSLFLILI